ncbi:MAG: hypothetical protein HC880_00875 [Bacteroidia bacterium]|nr:hypothetical protein [Bacteroidia bacterium]
MVQKINQYIFVCFLAKEFFEAKIGVGVDVLCHGKKQFCCRQFTNFLGLYERGSGKIDDNGKVFVQGGIE